MGKAKALAEKFGSEPVEEPIVPRGLVRSATVSGPRAVVSFNGRVRDCFVLNPLLFNLL